MGWQKILSWAAAAAGMLVLILDSKTALAGAAEGMELCIRTVIPSLFPFILLSGILVEGFSGINMPVLRPISRFFSMPKGTEVLLIPAFLGGYPVGAQSIGSAYAAGSISKKDAQRLLTFCSNAGPSFLFGMVASMFPEKWMVWALWGIQIFTAWMVSTLFSAPGSSASLPKPARSGASVMTPALKAMANICGWVVIFRVLIAFLDRWVLWLLPTQWQVVVMGILELSNGCCGLSAIESVPLRFVIASCMLSFGGICVILQTQSVIQGISIKYYLIGKGLQTIFSLLLSLSVVLGFWHWAVLVGILFPIIPRKMRKSSSNPLSVGV